MLSKTIIIMTVKLLRFYVSCVTISKPLFIYLFILGGEMYILLCRHIPLYGISVSIWSIS